MDVMDLNEIVCCKINTLMEMYKYYKLDTSRVEELHADYGAESVEYVLNDNKSGLEQYIIGKDLQTQLQDMFSVLNDYSPSRDCPDLYWDYTNSIITLSSEHISDKCSCGNTMVYKADRSQMVCVCGQVENVVTIEARDNNSRSRVSSYNKINRRRNYILQCIFGIEDTDIPTEVLDYLRKCIADDQIRMNRVSCKLLRMYMEKKYAKYNVNVVKIMHMITGHEKYHPTTFEVTRILNLHKLACDIYTSHYPGRSIKNTLFFSKIIEIVCWMNPHRETILANIHKPNDITYRNNEEIWEVIRDNSCGKLSLLA